ncbi:unnamed protein product [Callosobruchus maculatus]|uniref:Uncharacterized protein n=1 Tax=Callosobruchus maculatus TaxID=64391 RepID=A0A653CDZ0_CALMS|nr:unnamed protein product [Callosobruchus maculatus]
MKAAILCFLFLACCLAVTLGDGIFCVNPDGSKVNCNTMSQCRRCCEVFRRSAHVCVAGLCWCP